MSELSPYDKARRDLNMLDRYHNLRTKKSTLRNSIMIQEAKLSRMKKTYSDLCKALNEQASEITEVHRREGLSL